METLYNEPPEIRAGDTVAWLKSDADYPASAGYTNYYSLRNSTSVIDITSTTGPDGGSFLTYKVASQTTGWTAGTYGWVRYVAKGADRYTRGSGTIKVLPYLSGATGYELRTDARQIYDSLLAKYKTFISSGGEMQSMTIAGKSVAFRTAADFIQQIEHWARLVQQEEAAEAVAKGFADPRRVGVRLTRI